MSKKFLMDKQKILIYFSKLNELLAGDGVELKFFVNGGANMCLYMQTREATHDIDVSTRGMDLKQMLDRTVKGVELSNLTVWFFDWKVMLVQKISASREQPDITDAVAIIRKYNIKDLDEVDGWMKELQDKWYSMSSRYKAKNMLDIAWNIDETSYSLLRTALDIKGYRDKTVDYYAQLILADLGIAKYNDVYETALTYFDDWLKI